MRCTTAAAGPDAIRKCEIFFYESTHMAGLTGRIPLIDFTVCWKKRKRSTIDVL